MKKNLNRIIKNLFILLFIIFSITLFVSCAKDIDPTQEPFKQELIQYADGDDKDHVTKDLILKNEVSVNKNGTTYLLAIIWKSTELSHLEIVGSNGIVTRDPNTDLTIIITATARYKSFTTTNEYYITIIKQTPEVTIIGDDELTTDQKLIMVKDILVSLGTNYTLTNTNGDITKVTDYGLQYSKDNSGYVRQNNRVFIQAIYGETNDITSLSDEITVDYYFQTFNLYNFLYSSILNDGNTLFITKQPLTSSVSILSKESAAFNRISFDIIESKLYINLLNGPTTVTTYSFSDIGTTLIEPASIYFLQHFDNPYYEYSEITNFFSNFDLNYTVTDSSSKITRVTEYGMYNEEFNSTMLSLVKSKGDIFYYGEYNYSNLEFHLSPAENSITLEHFIELYGELNDFELADFSFVDDILFTTNPDLIARYSNLGSYGALFDITKINFMIDNHEVYLQLFEGSLIVGEYHFSRIGTTLLPIALTYYEESLKVPDLADYDQDIQDITNFMINLDINYTYTNLLGYTFMVTQYGMYDGFYNDSYGSFVRNHNDIVYYARYSLVDNTVSFPARQTPFEYSSYLSVYQIKQFITPNLINKVEDKYYIYDEYAISQISFIIGYKSSIDTLSIVVEGDDIYFELYYNETLKDYLKFTNIGTTTITAAQYYYNSVTGDIVPPDPDGTNSYTYTFNTNSLQTNYAGNTTQNEWTWNYTDLTYRSFNNSKGSQIGSNSSPQVNWWSFSTILPDDSIIVSYSVVLSNSNNGQGAALIEFGEHSNQFQFLSSIATPYGEISLQVPSTFFKVSLKANNNQAFYIKSINIKYLVDPDFIPGDDTPVNPNPGTVTYDEKLTSVKTLNQLNTETFGQTGMPSIGEYSVLVIPVEFTNVLFRSDYLYYLDLVFNGTSQQTGWESISSYYYKSSFGKLNISFDIQEKYELGEPTTYLEGSEDGDERSIFRQILEYYDDEIDYSEYDSNGDGCIDSVYFIYSNLYDPSVTPWWAWCYHYLEDVEFDGVKLFLYQWSSFFFIFDDMPGLNLTVNAEIYIHETGHLLSIDDLYSPDDYTFAGLGGFDMMDWNRGDHGPFNKLSLGWIEPYISKVGTANISLNSYATTGEAILIPFNRTTLNSNKVFSEYLLLSFHTPTGLYAGHLGSGQVPTQRGLAIYHVDARMKNKQSMGSVWGSFINSNQDENLNSDLVEILEADHNNTIRVQGMSNSDLLRVGTINLADYYTWNQGNQPIKVIITINYLKTDSINLTITIS